MWKFSKLKDNEQHSFLVYVWGSGTFCVRASRYTGVGHCSVYFSLGLSTTFIVIDGIISTLSFYTNPPHGRCYGNKNFHMTEEEFKEIVNEISNDCALDLAKQAKWELLHKDDSDTVVVSVSITKVVCLGDNKKENHIVERLTAQQTPESIKCAIVTLNEKILSQLQIDNI